MREVTFDNFISFAQPIALKVKVRDDLRSGAELPDRDEAEATESSEFLEDESWIDDEELLPAPEPDLNPDDEEIEEGEGQRSPRHSS